MNPTVSEGDPIGSPVLAHKRSRRSDVTKDRILPFENTARRLEALNSNIRLVPVENGPHNIGWTFPEECNQALLGFLG
jgi:pimeloyl-ACP methyl ester carboxylesterase